MWISTATRNLAPIFALLSAVSAQSRYQPAKDPQSPPDISYTRYYTLDRFDRRITFYVSGDQAERLPLVVSILGSGAYSNFIRIDGRTREAHRADREIFTGKAHLVIVEKPGVEFLEHHANSNLTSQASAEFRREHTLERWAEAVSAALRAARELPLCDPSRCLTIGSSEGGIVAARVAAMNRFVTHVASLAGDGPTQLFGLLESARDGHLYEDSPQDPDQQTVRLLADVAAIESDPDNPDQYFLGHPYRRWSTFWSSSTMEELLQTKARVFIAQGTADRNASVAGSDVLYATLLAKGRDVTLRRIAGADHAFQIADQPGRDGWRGIFEDARNWFLQ
jgi:dienelactone hydrolase